MSFKTRSRIILTLVTLLGVLTALFFLLGTIPLHFGAKGADSVAGKQTLSHGRAYFKSS